MSTYVIGASRAEVNGAAPDKDVPINLKDYKCDISNVHFGYGIMVYQNSDCSKIWINGNFDNSTFGFDANQSWKKYRKLTKMKDELIDSVSHSDMIYLHSRDSLVLFANNRFYEFSFKRRKWRKWKLTKIERYKGGAIVVTRDERYLILVRSRSISVVDIHDRRLYYDLDLKAPSWKKYRAILMNNDEINEKVIAGYIKLFYNDFEKAPLDVLNLMEMWLDKEESLYIVETKMMSWGMGYGGIEPNEHWKIDIKNILSYLPSHDYWTFSF